MVANVKAKKVMPTYARDCVTLKQTPLDSSRLLTSQTVVSGLLQPSVQSRLRSAQR